MVSQGRDYPSEGDIPRQRLRITKGDWLTMEDLLVVAFVAPLVS